MSENPQIPTTIEKVVEKVKEKAQDPRAVHWAIAILGFIAVIAIIGYVLWKKLKGEPEKK